MPRYNYGGQALIEGVLMRGRDAIAVALATPTAASSGPRAARRRLPRQPLGEAAVPARPRRPVRDPHRRYAVADPERRPPGRGGGRRARQGLDRPDAGITLIAGIGIFFLLPLFIASVTTSNIENRFVQHLVEGLVRVAIFLGYLALIGQAPDIRRVFQYHGAEHMTIHALEHGDPLSVDEIRVPDGPPALRHGVPGRRHRPLDHRLQPGRPAGAAG